MSKLLCSHSHGSVDQHIFWLHIVENVSEQQQQGRRMDDSHFPGRSAGTPAPDPASRLSAHCNRAMLSWVWSQFWGGLVHFMVSILIQSQTAQHLHLLLPPHRFSTLAPLFPPTHSCMSDLCTRWLRLCLLCCDCPAPLLPPSAHLNTVFLPFSSHQSGIQAGKSKITGKCPSSLCWCLDEPLLRPLQGNYRTASLGHCQPEQTLWRRRLWWLSQALKSHWARDNFLQDGRRHDLTPDGRARLWGSTTRENLRTGKMWHAWGDAVCISFGLARCSAALLFRKWAKESWVRQHNEKHLLSTESC